VTLDAFTSLGGDHGPSDALFKGEYVIPFLGLDKTGELDPEVEQCQSSGGGSGGGGSGGSAGSATNGGSAGAGGSGGAEAGGAGSGGASGVGGTSTSGNSGGSPAAGGGMSSGGSAPLNPSAGTGATSAGAGNAVTPGLDEGGCSCRVGSAGSPSFARAWLALALAGLTFAGRRRR
jgi:MYXO-CTERM domain-containing protein